MEIMSFQSKFPCFVQYGPQKAIAGFKARLLYGQTLTDQQVTRLVDGLVKYVGWFWGLCVYIMWWSDRLDSTERSHSHHTPHFH